MKANRSSSSWVLTHVSCRLVSDALRSRLSRPQISVSCYVITAASLDCLALAGSILSVLLHLTGWGLHKKRGLRFTSLAPLQNCPLITALQRQSFHKQMQPSIKYLSEVILPQIQMLEIFYYIRKKPGEIISLVHSCSLPLPLCQAYKGFLHTYRASLRMSVHFQTLN